MLSRVIKVPCLQIQRPLLLSQIRTVTSKSFIFIAYYDRIIYSHDIANDADVGSILISFQIDIFFFITSLVSVESVAEEVTKVYRYLGVLDPLKCQVSGVDLITHRRITDSVASVLILCNLRLHETHINAYRSQ